MKNSKASGCCAAIYLLAVPTAECSVDAEVVFERCLTIRVQRVHWHSQCHPLTSCDPKGGQARWKSENTEAVFLGCPGWNVVQPMSIKRACFPAGRIAHYLATMMETAIQWYARLSDELGNRVVCAVSDSEWSVID